MLGLFPLNQSLVIQDPNAFGFSRVIKVHLISYLNSEVLISDILHSNRFFFFNACILGKQECSENINQIINKIAQNSTCVEKITPRKHNC